MSQINLKSILGITSITTPAGVDDVFTVHSNDTTERFRVDQNGNQVVAGILTVTQDLNVDGHTNLDNVSIAGVSTFSDNIRLAAGKVYGFSADTNTYITNYQPDSIEMTTGGVERFELKATNSGNSTVLTISDDGNHGDVYGGTGIVVHGSSGARIKFAQSSLGYGIAAGFEVGAYDGGAYLINREPQDIFFSIAPNSSSNPSELVRITSAGHMGLGSNNPTKRLTVQAGSNNTDIALFTGNDLNRGLLISTVAANSQNDMGVVYHAHGQHAGSYLGEHIFKTNNTERLRITSTGDLGINNSIPQKKVHISTTGNQKIVIDPNYSNNSGGSSNSEANANNIVESVLIRTSYGDNAASSANAGHKWGIKFQGYNGNDFTQARSKCAGVFAVSEDTGAGYNRNVGLAFHTSQFDTAHREVMRINTNGIVTKPYQYTFLVDTTNHQKSANWSKITDHAPVAAQCTNVSDGTNWSNSTQRFTAPVAGVYHFYVGGWSYGNSNGSRYAYCFKHQNGNNFDYIGGGDYCSGDSPMAGWSRDIKLSAGEWVELWGYSVIAVRWGGGHHFFWGGYLLG